MKVTQIGKPMQRAWAFFVHTLGMSMAEKRAHRAALSANHEYEAWPLFMTMWQSIGLLSLIFSLTFWQGEIFFGHVENCPYLCRVV